MLRRLRDYLEQRRRDKDREFYTRGFEWAMRAYYVEKQPIEHIEAHLIGDLDSDLDVVFDRGAQHAVNILAELLKNVEDASEMPDRASLVNERLGLSDTEGSHDGHRDQEGSNVVVSV